MKVIMDYLKTFLIIIIIIIPVQMITYFPWWSFIIFAIATGVWIDVRKYKISPFLTGFIAGFLIWFLGNVYFHFSYGGSLFSNEKNIPVYLILIGSGLIGGILTGLSIYVGSQILKESSSPSIKISTP